MMFHNKKTNGFIVISIIQNNKKYQKNRVYQILVMMN